MLRLEIAGRAIGRVVVASGEELIVGRAPLAADADPKVNSTVVELKGAAKHVSRILFTIEVGNEVARLRFKGSGEAQLASLFDAPAGARRVTVVRGMSVLLDEGEPARRPARRRARGRYPHRSAALDRRHRHQRRALGGSPAAVDGRA